MDVVPTTSSSTSTFQTSFDKSANTFDIVEEIVEEPIAEGDATPKTGTGNATEPQTPKTPQSPLSPTRPHAPPMSPPSNPHHKEWTPSDLIYDNMVLKRAKAKAKDIEQRKKDNTSELFEARAEIRTLKGKKGRLQLKLEDLPQSAVEERQQFETGIIAADKELSQAMVRERVAQHQLTEANKVKLTAEEKRLLRGAKVLQELHKFDWVQNGQQSREEYVKSVRARHKEFAESVTAVVPSEQGKKELKAARQKQAKYEKAEKQFRSAYYSAFQTASCNQNKVRELSALQQAKRAQFNEEVEKEREAHKKKSDELPSDKTAAELKQLHEDLQHEKQALREAEAKLGKLQEEFEQTTKDLVTADHKRLLRGATAWKNKENRQEIQRQKEIMISSQQRLQKQKDYAVNQQQVVLQSIKKKPNSKQKKRNKGPAVKKRLQYWAQSGSTGDDSQQYPEQSQHDDATQQQHETHDEQNSSSTSSSSSSSGHSTSSSNTSSDDDDVHQNAADGKGEALPLTVVAADPSSNLGPSSTTTTQRQGQTTRSGPTTTHHDPIMYTLNGSHNPKPPLGGNHTTGRNKRHDEDEELYQLLWKQKKENQQMRDKHIRRYMYPIKNSKLSYKPPKSRFAAVQRDSNPVPPADITETDWLFNHGQPDLYATMSEDQYNPHWNQPNPPNHFHGHHNNDDHHDNTNNDDTPSVSGSVSQRMQVNRQRQTLISSNEFDNGAGGTTRFNTISSPKTDTTDDSNCTLGPGLGELGINPRRQLHVPIIQTNLRNYSCTGPPNKKPKRKVFRKRTNISRDSHVAAFLHIAHTNPLSVQELTMTGSKGHLPKISFEARPPVPLKQHYADDALDAHELLHGGMLDRERGYIEPMDNKRRVYRISTKHY